MKYIKTYEDIGNEDLDISYGIKVGDYIKVKGPEFGGAKVLSSELTDKGYGDPDMYYYCEFIFNNQMVESWIKDSDIERKMSTEEIEQFKIKLDLIKYNI